MEVGIGGISVTEVKGFGDSVGTRSSTAAASARSIPLKIRVEVVSKDEDVERVVKAIIASARTGQIRRWQDLHFQTSRTRSG